MQTPCFNLRLIANLHILFCVLDLASQPPTVVQMVSLGLVKRIKLTPPQSSYCFSSATNLTNATYHATYTRLHKHSRLLCFTTLSSTPVFFIRSTCLWQQGVVLYRTSQNFSQLMTVRETMQKHVRKGGLSISISPNVRPLQPLQSLLVLVAFHYYWS